MCVDGVRRLCEQDGQHIERYRKMQRYLERRRALHSIDGSQPVPNGRQQHGGAVQEPATVQPATRAAISKSEVPASAVSGENRALAVATVAGSATVGRADDHGTDEITPALSSDESAKAEPIDSSKLMLIDPCIYNLKEVC